MPASLLSVHPMSDAERTEWRAWRKLGIGASDVAALVGMSNYASPMSVWTDKLGLAGPDEDKDYMEYGRRAEPMLTGYFEDRTGLFVVRQQERAIHPDHPHHRATLDGLACEHPDGDPLGVVEYKTTGWGAWDEIPDAYAIQVQWQMHVAQQDHAWFGVLHDRKFATYEVERDQRAIDMLIGVVDQFWNDHVLAETAPPADAHKATAKALAEAYPEPVEGETAPLDDLAWALELRTEAAAQMSEAKVNKERADNAIKAAIGDREIGTLHGEPVVTWKQSTRKGYTVEDKTTRTLRAVGGKR
jgi:putative phage-type endonuclease